MRLFDEIERADTSPAKYGQPRFDYVNRSARSKVKAIRDVLEDWFAEYPEQERPDLRGRFRSPDNRQHFGAFFELYLYTLFRRLEYSVSLHSAMEGKSTRPDFMIERGDGAIYLEATLAAPSDEDVAAANRENRVYDALDRMDSPNFFVGVHVIGAPEEDPPAARMRPFLEAELSRLDPDEVVKLFDQGGLDALPRWSFEHAGWRVEFFPVPKSPEARGKPGVRPLGYRMFGPEYIESREGIVGALSSKAGKYGDLDSPYVIAVNIFDEFVDDIDAVEALFGQEELIIINLPDGGFRTEYGRKPNGLWRGQSGPTYTRVSGVLVLENFSYWDIAAKSPVLWHNPWAAKPLTKGIWPFAEVAADLETGRLQRSDPVKTPRELLQLPDDWPIG